MPNDEVEIMRDAFCFLRDHNEPPANDSERLVAFWERTAFDMGRLAEKWNGHPLAVIVLAGLYEYLGKKAEARTKVQAETRTGMQTSGQASAWVQTKTTSGTKGGGLG